ncbi:pentapeptide repeat-containing protein [Streptomyces sp. NPDC002054]|uniref:pentapeptide repeat-containing protein n=1 Tax=Streptomyces sp. NPDC002054 TaxID=3154663 RepID=UPI0033272317
MSDEHPTPKRRPWWHWALAAAGTAAFLAALIWGPWWIEGHHLRDDRGELVSSAGIIITGFRTMLIAIVAGIFTGLGLRYTHKSHQQTEKLFEHTREKDREQAELTREGQVTDRYVEAIKLLASDKLHERLGGIYSLERIMKDSERDHRTIVEVLSAFIRTKLAEDARPKKKDKKNSEKRPYKYPLADELFIPPRDDLRQLPEDIRAALSVLNRRDSQRRRTVPMDLQGAELHHRDLEGVDWRWANLSQANLTRASLKFVHFEGANLRNARFQGVDMSLAHLNRANLNWADLEDADLESAVLESADLQVTRLTGANLSMARGLTPEQLSRASIYDSTQLPEELEDDPQIQARRETCEGWKVKRAEREAEIVRMIFGDESASAEEDPASA